MISHRLKTVQSCDLIFVLDSGKIVESGTHNELIQIPNGTYANFFKKQSLLGAITTLSQTAKQPVVHKIKE